ncbi:MAG: cyanase [Actinomycetota bacterium]|nr:cyanase [Actinomycetota bacterium]
MYEVIDSARRACSLSWTELADRVGGPRLHTVAALLGQQPLSAEQARRAGEVLGLDAEVTARLTEIPKERVGSRLEVPADPTLYRFYEALGVYGPALRALLHEEFGDGIMSAINFSIDLRRVPDPGGDRVEVVLNGKFLAYQWE